MEEQALILQKRQFNAIIIAGIAIAVLFYPVVGSLLLFKSIYPVWRVILSRVIIWTSVPLVYQYAVKIEGREFFIWKETKRNIYFYIAVIAVLFVLIFGAQIISSIPRRFGFDDNLKVLKDWNKLLKQNMVLLVFVCLTAGITEELLLRAYIFPRLSLIFKSGYLPVLISSLLFSLMHLGYGNLSECIFTFLFGLICAVCYQKYRNIKVLIIFHFLYDLLIFI